MGFLKWLLGVEEKKAVQMIQPPISYQFNPIKGAFMPTSTSYDVKKYIDNAFNINSTVYSIISTASEKFSTIPWILYKVKSASKAKQYKAMTERYSDSPDHLRRMLALKNEAFDEVNDNDIINKWENPNDQQSGAEFRACAVMFKMLTGAGPIWANMGLTRTEMQEMFVLPSQFIVLTPDATLNKIARVAYTISGSFVEIPVEDLMYWKYNNPNFDITGQHLYGQAPLRAAGVEVDADNQNVLAQKFMFENSGIAGIWTPKDMITAQTMSDPQVDQLRETMDSIHDRTNAGKSARPYLNIPIDYTSYGMDAQQMDLVQSRRLSKEFIANVFNFPPALLSLERATDNNFDAAVKYLTTNTIYANLCSFRDKVANRWYLSKWKDSSQYYLDFDISGMPELQGDFQKMIDGLSKMYWLTEDEKRVAMKYDEKGGAYATAHIPAGLVPIEMAGMSGNIDPIDPTGTYE